MKAIKNFAINHLEPRFYGALWCSAATVIALMVGMAAWDAVRFQKEITFFGAMLAINIACIGWLWSGRMAILMARKTNAINLLARIGAADVNRIKATVYPYIEAYDKFKREDDCTARPAMPEREIQELLGLYEQISVAVIYGAVDQEIIKQSQMLVFKRIYRGLCHHIERAQEGDSRLFIHFENLTCTWHPDLQKRAATLTSPGGLFSPMRGADT